jgi:ABC-type lipoprotein release transport system permease subunit
MNRLYVLSRISLKYWMQHKKRFFTFMIIVMLGAMALFSSALLIRSEKQTVLDEELTLLGDYDTIFYNISDADVARIIQDHSVTAYGSYTTIGYVMSQENTRVGVGCFPDAKSCNMYHMSCTEGRYPRKQNEIAIDISKAKELGVYPHPGEKVDLSLYSYDKEAIVHKEFVISGIFDAENEYNPGTWERYPLQLDQGNVEIPGAFISRDYARYASDNSSTLFIQMNVADPDKAAERFRKLVSDEQTVIDVPFGRKYAYSYILGISDTISAKYGSLSFKNVLKAIHNGDGIKDFYSSVLMPIFTILIALIAVFSIYGITENVVKDKKEQTVVLRSIGLDKKSMFIGMWLDFTVLSVIFFAIGIIIGMVFHVGMIRALNHFFNLNLQYGYQCDKAVSVVTASPLLLAFNVTMLCIQAAAIFVLIRLMNDYPLEESTADTHRRKRDRSDMSMTGWRRLLGKRIPLSDVSVMIICVIGICSAVFGYSYFSAYSDSQNMAIRSKRESYGLKKWDYVASKNRQSVMYVFNIENDHDYGISTDCYKELKKSKMVSRCFARIVNRSTRLTYDKDRQSEKDSIALKKYSLREYEDNQDDDQYEKAEKDAEEAMIEDIGYRSDENIYAAPAIGLSDDDLKGLDKYVVSGSIDPDKINDGKAVIIALDKAGYENLSDLFTVGDRLPLSDIALSEEEEKLDFSNFIPGHVKDPVYSEPVITPEGEKVNLTSYSFGKRKDIDTEIGAIVVFDRKTASQYMYKSDGEHNGINVICGFDTFSAWGLPDRNLTDMSMKLTKSAERDINKADVYWYSLISGAKGISVNSVSEIFQKINSTHDKIMCIYYSMIIILIIFSIVMIAIKQFTDIRMNGSRFAVLRSCGMSVGQIAYLVIKQDLLYPVIGIILSIIPVAVCNQFLRFVKKMLYSGKWTYEKNPWCMDIPYHENLYKYHLPLTMIIVFVVYALVMMIIAFSQLHYISTTSVTDEIETSEF